MRNAPQARYILEWENDLSKYAPPLPLVFAGMLAPMQLNGLHFMNRLQLILLVPQVLLFAWAVTLEWEAACPGVPGLYPWVYAECVCLALMFLSRLVTLVRTTYTMMLLKEMNKNAEERRRQERFMDDGKEPTKWQTILNFKNELVHQILVSGNTLIMLDTVLRSKSMKLLSLAMYMWLFVVGFWGLILCVGWTFIPGQAVFHDSLQESDRYCGAWRIVFVMRLSAIYYCIMFCFLWVNCMFWA